MSAKCRAWTKFSKDTTARTLPKIAFCAGWDAAKEFYSPTTEHSVDMGALLVPTTPEPELIDSMCLRHDHDFGIKRIIRKITGNYVYETDEEFEFRKDATRAIMRQLYEEATGQGFFQR